MTREHIQQEALAAINTANGLGTLNIDTGVGKSKIVIDFIKQHPEIRRVLITSPRTNLKANWHLELVKWGIEPDQNDPARNYVIDGRHVSFVFENIQTAYKFGPSHFDLIIGDEAHLLITPEYSRLFLDNRGTYTILLTATMDIKWKPEKRDMYNHVAPLVYQYLTAEEDGIVNRIEIIIVEHTLTDDFEVLTGGSSRKWLQGEAKTYNYLFDRIATGETMMQREMEAVLKIREQLLRSATNGIVNDHLPEYFESIYEMADYWFYQKHGNVKQKEAGRAYLTAVNGRRDFLYNLTSNRSITRQLLKKEWYESAKNKILVFSERTKQVDQICQHTVHSNNKDEVNAKNLADFNSGAIRVLGSCYSLTLGLNLVEANRAIFETYSSTSTSGKQRLGRLHRLPTEELARAYVLRINDTQSERWLSSMLRGFDIADTITSTDVLSWKFPDKR